MSQTPIPTNIRPMVPGWASNLAILLLIALLWPLGQFMQRNLDDYFLLVLLFIGINVILASSLNLINGITGQFSLGHAGFMAVGAYASGVLLKQYALHHDPASPATLLVFVGLLLFGGIAASLAGLVVGIPVLRLRGDYLAIATLGFGEIINTFIINTESIHGYDVGGASGLHGIPALADFFGIYAAVILCVVCVWRIVHSIKGKALLAIREDEIAASAMGINPTYYKVAAFVIGAFFAGVAGGLSAALTGNLDPESFRFMRSIEIVVMVVLGGSGSVTGTILAAVLLTCAPEGLRKVKEITGEDFRMVLYALLLIFMMLLRPQGLLGNREIWWTRRWRPRAAGPENNI